MKPLAPYRGTLLRLAAMNTLLVGAVAAVLFALDRAGGVELARAFATDASSPDAGAKRKPADRPLTPEDRRFVTAAAELAWEGLRVAGSGAAQANGVALRNFAREITARQIAMRNQIEALAARKGVLLPTGVADSAAADKLAAAPGGRFDDAFVEWAATTQAAGVRLFQEAARDCTDPELREFAEQMLAQWKAQHENARRLKRALF